MGMTWLQHGSINIHEEVDRRIHTEDQREEINTKPETIGPSVSFVIERQRILLGIWKGLWPGSEQVLILAESQCIPAGEGQCRKIKLAAACWSRRGSCKPPSRV